MQHFFHQHDYRDGSDLTKNKKDKKKKKKKESDDETEKITKTSSLTPSGGSTKPIVAEGDSEIRQRKGDDVVTAEKTKEVEKDEQEDTKQ